MEAHKIYELAMDRGDAKRVAAELGYTSAEVPRRWRRPLARPTNLFTGELSPLMKAKAEILAHDRVSAEAADVLLFDLFSAVARQRSQRARDDNNAVLVALTLGYHNAINALLSGNTTEAEENFYRAGAAVVRALLFVIGDDGDGAAALLRVDVELDRAARVRTWLRKLFATQWF